MFIIETIISIIKIIIIGAIVGPILIFIISIIKTKLENTNSAVSYDSHDSDDERFYIKDESAPSSTPQFTVSVTMETSTPNKTGKEWDDISQSEIDSVKCYGDNMSKHDYKIRVKYIPTNRMRTVTINAFDEADALSQLSPEYVKDSATVSFSEYPHPTENQIHYAIYLGIQIPEKCCQHDLSALLSQRTTQTVPVALIDFALSHGICFSYYGDEPYLINKIAISFQTQEWITFAITCMNRHINKSWNFSEWEIYSAFGLECMNNTSFMNSLKRTHFPDGFYGFEYSECSHDTIFYKTLRNYIVNH